MGDVAGEQLKRLGPLSSSFPVETSARSRIFPTSSSSSSRRRCPTQAPTEVRRPGMGDRVGELF